MGSLGLTLTIVFGILSVILYFRGRRWKRLTFTYDSTTLQTRTHPEIKILFRDKNIENLSRLRVVIWNSGNQDIRRTDIPIDGSPAIVLSGGRVLSVAVLAASPDTKCTALQNGDNIVSIDFEFLNPDDYATIDVLYESIGPKRADVLFTARVIGGRQPASRYFVRPFKPITWVVPIFFISGWCVASYYWARAVPKWVQFIPNNGIAIKVVGAFYLTWIACRIVGLLGSSSGIFAHLSSFSLATSRSTGFWRDICAFPIAHTAMAEFAPERATASDTNSMDKKIPRVRQIQAVRESGIGASQPVNGRRLYSRLHEGPFQ